jgi:hypothetical protein
MVLSNALPRKFNRLAVLKFYGKAWFVIDFGFILTAA